MSQQDTLIYPDGKQYSYHAACFHSFTSGRDTQEMKEGAVRYKVSLSPKDLYSALGNQKTTLTDISNYVHQLQRHGVVKERIDPLDYSMTFSMECTINYIKANFFPLREIAEAPRRFEVTKLLMKDFNMGFKPAYVLSHYFSKTEKGNWFSHGSRDHTYFSYMGIPLDFTEGIARMMDKGYEGYLTEAFKNLSTSNDIRWLAENIQ